MTKKSILICGIGAIGSNLATLLSADNRGEFDITVLDKDKVEERNVQAGTQFYQKDQVGMSKVEALQYNIYKWYEREIRIINEQFNGTIENWDSYDLTIDCFDNYEARNLEQLYYQTGKDIGIQTDLLHIGFSDQFTFAIEWAENYKVPTDITSGFDICEMEGAASFVRMVASLGSLVVQDYVKNGRKREFIGNKFSLRELL